MGTQVLQRVLGSLVCAASIGAALPGCSSSSLSAPVPIDQLAARVASAVCDNISGCCQSASLAFDANACKQNAVSQIQKLVDENTRPNIRYDASAGGRCVAAYTSVAKSCVLQDEDLAACDDMFVGTLPAGASCMDAAECAPSVSGGDGFCNFAASDSLTTTGVCAQGASGGAAHGKQGDACSGSCTSADCAVGAPVGTDDATVLTVCFTTEGLFCAASGVCQPLLALGDACQSGDVCQTGSYCDSTQSLCAPVLADGAVCASSSDCASGHCAFSSDNSGVLGTGVCAKESVASASVCSGAAD